MTATAQGVLEVSIEWLRDVVRVQPFGNVKLEVTIQSGNIVCIRRGIEETSKP
jgi:hypothetical protein